ncbi:MAG: PQQ-binding-like beta-propeller repeat protein, partial [Bacteroidales bacterium]|nr:PQQ-binding-like beta-propeller repeat protein [Bacteroidales bacterium]
MKKYFLLIALLICNISGYSAGLLSTDIGPPIEGKKALVRFAYLADLHISDVAANVEDLEISVKDINSLKGIDFVILAGDITEFGSDEEILLAKSIIDKLTVPYYIVAGNHDSKWSESGCNTFSKVFGYEHFNFNFNGIQFIGTNSGPNMRMAPALVPRETIVWLDTVTRALPHHIPVVFINHYPLDEGMLNYKTIIDMLKRVNTQVSMCGHGHSNRVMNFDGIPGIMGRSNLRGNPTPATPTQPAKPAHPAYNIVTITTDTITYAVRSNSHTHKPWHKQPIKKESPPAMWGPSGKDRVDSPASAVWVYQDDSDIGSAAAFAFNMVFISNTAGVVKALDAADGSVKWSFKTDGKIFSSPEVCEKTGLLVVGSSDNHIYCLNAKTGKLKWKVEATKSVLGSPTIHKGIVYIGASDNAFRAIELSSGHLLWFYSHIKGFIEAKPWADDQEVYIGDWANELYEFEPKNG